MKSEDKKPSDTAERSGGLQVCMSSDHNQGTEDMVTSNNDITDRQRERERDRDWVERQRELHSDG